MTRRVLLCGGPTALRQRLAAEIDSGFDVVLEEAREVQAALERLPASEWDLFVVLADGGRAPGLDLVRFLEEHALHGQAPVLVVGGSEESRRAALAAGAERAVGENVAAGELAELVQELLDLR